MKDNFIRHEIVMVRPKNVKLEPIKMLLYMRLISLSNNKFGVCYATNESLAVDLCVCEKTIRNKLNELELLEYIKVNKNDAQFGRSITTKNKPRAVQNPKELFNEEYKKAMVPEWVDDFFDSLKR